MASHGSKKADAYDNGHSFVRFFIDSEEIFAYNGKL
jgi:hypothetical protein